MALGGPVKHAPAYREHTQRGVASSVVANQELESDNSAEEKTL